MQVVKEKENLKAELAKAQSKIKHAEIAVLEYTAQIDNLNHILEEADAEKLRQEKELAIITSEQSVLGAQVYQIVFCSYYRRLLLHSHPFLVVHLQECIY